MFNHFYKLDIIPSLKIGLIIMFMHILSKNFWIDFYLVLQATKITTHPCQLHCYSYNKFSSEPSLLKMISSKLTTFIL